MGSAASIRDAAGRDVRAALARADGVAFSTDSAVLGRAIAGGPTQDYLLITAAKPSRTDSLALVLRARSSLLATAVLYDYMLGRPGASALDWLGRDLARIATVVELATWHAEHFGMRVDVLDGDQWRPVTRLIGFGPVAWSDIGVVVPALGSDSVRIRVSFTADEFRIDQVAVGSSVRRLEQRTVTLRTRVRQPRGAAGRPGPDASRGRTIAMSRRIRGDHFSNRVRCWSGGSGYANVHARVAGLLHQWVRGNRWHRHRSLPFSPARTPIRNVLSTWRASRDTLGGSSSRDGCRSHDSAHGAPPIGLPNGVHDIEAPAESHGSEFGPGRRRRTGTARQSQSQWRVARGRRLCLRAAGTKSRRDRAVQRHAKRAVYASRRPVTGVGTVPDACTGSWRTPD